MFTQPSLGRFLCILAPLLPAWSLAAGVQEVALTVEEPAGVARRAETVACGIPFPPGLLSADAVEGGQKRLTLFTADDKAVPAQFKITSKRSDGSVRWLLMVFQQDIEARARVGYILRWAEASPAPRPHGSVCVEKTERGYRVDNGSMRFEIPLFGRCLMDKVAVRQGAGSWQNVCDDGVHARLTRMEGGEFISKVQDIILEENGPLRATIKIIGEHLNEDNQHLFGFVARIEVYAGQREIKLTYTFINDHRDGVLHPHERYHTYLLNELKNFKWVDNRWVDKTPEEKLRNEDDLLNDNFGAVPIKTATLRMPFTTACRRYRLGIAGDSPMAGNLGDGVVLTQTGPAAYTDEDGWQAILTTLADGTPIRTFDRARGWFELNDNGSGVRLAVKYFPFYHPKRIVLNERAIEIDLWSDAAPMIPPELGFAKTHEMLISFGDLTDEPDGEQLLTALESPLLAVASPQWYVDSGVFGRIGIADMERFAAFEEKLLADFRGFPAHRDQHKEYGLRNFGDQAYERYPRGWINQEYDFLYGALIQFIRTGQRVYFDEANIGYGHYADVDILHVSNNPLAEGGPHMHFTDHAKGEVHIGHAFVEGVFLHYFLTGDPRALEVGRRIADFFVKVAAWKDFSDFRDDEERTYGWSLRSLVPAWLATGDPKYRLAAEMVVEQALANQNPETGNWDHDLYPNECPHRPLCRGGKPWMVGIIQSGLKLYHQTFADPRVKDMILKAADWQIREGWCEADGQGGFRYMTCRKYPQTDPGGGGLDLLEGLLYAYEISGDKKYAYYGLRVLENELPKTGTPAAPSVTSGRWVRALVAGMEFIHRYGNEFWRDGKVYFEELCPVANSGQATP